jgi:hypothetical protein
LGIGVPTVGPEVGVGVVVPPLLPVQAMKAAADGTRRRRKTLAIID